LRHKYKVEKKITDKIADGSDQVKEVSNYRFRNAAILNFTKDIYEGKFKISDKEFIVALNAEP